MRMFWEIFRFEVKYWLKQPMVYVFFLVYFLMMLGAICSDQVQLGEAVGNLKRNAPYMLQFHYAILVLLGMMSTTAFVQAATLRDFNHNAYQLVFSTPMGKIPYLAGRFFGAFTMATLPFLSVSVASLIAPHIAPVFDWMPAERFQPVNWMAHFNAITLFVLPNTLFISAIVFAIAALTRSTMLSFVGIIAMLLLWGLSGTLMDDLETKRYVLFTDPLAMRPFTLLTQYWTVADKNSLSLGWGNVDLLINRLIWIAASLLLMAITVWRFSFAERNAWFRKKQKTKPSPENSIENLPDHTQQAIPRATQVFNLGTDLQQYWVEVKTNFRYIVGGTAFKVILFAGVINLTASMEFAKEAFGLTALPVTYNLVDLIRGSMYIFTIAVLIFYTGSLVWRERDAKIEQIYDSTPHHSAIGFLSKTTAMVGALVLIQLISLLIGIGTQLKLSFYKFDLHVYLVELGAIQLSTFVVLVVVSIFLHTLINNKYIAYFAFLVIWVSSTMVKNVLHISTNMVGLADLPPHQYSDMNGWGPYADSLLWFSIYWLLLAGVLGLAAVLIWQRGSESAWKSRLSGIGSRFSGKTKLVGLITMFAFAACGAWVYYNTQVLNSYDVNYINEKQQADYEKLYKQYEENPQPTIKDVKFDIALFPKQRALEVNGEFLIENQHARNIDTLFFTFNETTDCELMLEGLAENILDDRETHFRAYRLKETLRPGEVMQLKFVSTYKARGFENAVQTTQIVRNGSFFNSMDICPILGYVPEGELINRTDRRRHNLPERKPMPSLKRDCSSSCMRPYLPNANWVTMETHISTSQDQIAVAPGSLIKEWKEDGRNHYIYRLDHPSAFFASFISARYEVAREKWNGLDLEVYYDAQHPYNVANMLRSMRQSIAYYTENFGPYYHKQVRIIEFPRYAGQFAQAFPGTMPYSESVGFISDIDPANDIDMVYYIVAHEIGHQWWAHQVLGAHMQGSTLLSETLAQYSALMVMEKEFGRDRMGKFLKYELDQYLDSRSGELRGEQPLISVEDQGYIHYQKGSASMYHLKEFIGEDSLNKALQRLIDSFAYETAYYPSSHELIDRLKAVTADSLQPLLAQLFEDIVLYDNRLEEASYRKVSENKYEVALNVESRKFRADSLGEETAMKLDDWIEFAVFAEPDDYNPKGKKLASRKVHLSEEKSTVRFVLREEPFTASIDPLNYIIDRVQGDNTKRLEKLE